MNAQKPGMVLRRSGWSLNGKRGTLLHALMETMRTPRAFMACRWELQPWLGLIANYRSTTRVLKNGMWAPFSNTKVIVGARGFYRDDKRNGVCLCVRNETTDDFEAQILRDRPQNSELYKADYPIERPYQHVVHDIAMVPPRLRWPTSWWWQWRRPMPTSLTTMNTTSCAATHLWHSSTSNSIPTPST